MSLYQNNIDERVARAMVDAKLKTKSETMAHAENPKQVRCADCWRWIDANKNHTCKQQIRRNRTGKKGA